MEAYHHAYPPPHAQGYPPAQAAQGYPPHAQIPQDSQQQLLTPRPHPQSSKDRLWRLLGVPRPVFDPEHRYVTSYLLSPLVLAIWRTIVAVYMLLALIYNFVTSGGAAFAYFTVLTYCGLFSYFTASAIHGYGFSRALRKWKAAHPPDFRGTLPTQRLEKSTPHDVGTLPSSRLDRSGTALQFIFSWLVSSVFTFPIIVTLVFWAVLSKGAFDNAGSAYSNISVHALNLGFSYLDLLFLSRAPMRPWLHLPLTLCLIAAYLGIAYIYAANSGIYVYSFLDPHAVGGNGAVAGICIAIGAATVVSFLLAQFLIWAREAVAAALQGCGIRKWGAAKPMGVDDAALFPAATGPGPHGEGSSRRAV